MSGNQLFCFRPIVYNGLLADYKTTYFTKTILGHAHQLYVYATTSTAIYVNEREKPKLI